MPNRYLKESICTSEDLDKLSPMAETLFYRLMVKADDFGCYYGNAAIIKSNCFPLKSDSIGVEQMQSWLNELSNAGLITIYTALDGRAYIHFCKWEKHQQRRAQTPKYPLPDDLCNQLITDDSKCSRIRNSESELSSNTTMPSQKNDYGEYGWVKLTDAQYQKLLQELGQTELDRCIQYIDEVAQSSGNKNKWKDWNLIIRRCHREGWGLRQGTPNAFDNWPGKANIPKAY